MPSLEVIIGLLLIILFYSLLATVLMELVSSFRGFRGKQLEKVLKMLLASDDKREEVLDQFKEHVLYKQLSGNLYGKNSPPSYLESPTFRSILLQVLFDREDSGYSMQDKIERLPDENLKESLRHLWNQAGHRLEDFQTEVESWYDKVMDRASGWYKRKITSYLLFVGFVIAVIFNVDLLTVYESLNRSSQSDLEQWVQVAQTIAQEEVFVEGENGVDREVIDQELLKGLQTNIQGLQNPMGIGWSEVKPTQDIFFWLLKLFGWIIMAICISKGAPFWFDLLKKAVAFRGTGNVPEKNTPEKTQNKSGDQPSVPYRPLVQEEQPVG